MSQNARSVVRSLASTAHDLDVILCVDNCSVAPEPIGFSRALQIKYEDNLVSHKQISCIYIVTTLQEKLELSVLSSPLISI